MMPIRLVPEESVSVDRIEIFARSAAQLLQEAHDHWCCANIVKNEKLVAILKEAKELNLI
jgi:hypothetical protein